MRIRFDKNKVDSFHQFLLSEPYPTKCETHGRARVSRVSTLMGKPLQWWADQSKTSRNGNIVQRNRTDSKQISPQPSRTFGDTNFLSRLVVSDKVSACGRESRSDCPGVGYPVFYSCFAQLKSWTWRPYSTNPTKKLSNGNLEKVWWDTVNTPCCTNSRLPYEKDVTIRSAEVYMRMIQVSVAATPQFFSFRPWISGLFQQYWRNGFAV